MNSRIKKMLSSRGDIFYALQKGFYPLVRGVIWQILRMRRPKLLFLGANVRFISAGRIDFGSGVSIGANSYIETCSQERCRIGDGVTVRENAWVQCRSGFNEPAVGLFIERGAYIGPNAVIGVGGPIYIGEGCQIGAGLTLSAEEHDQHGGDYTSGRVTRTGIKIGPRTWIGNNVTILDGVEIGEGCVLGAGAVVTRSIPAKCMALGVPARIVKK
jgi:acetyltransferase-like isoleucine patch superfamily enzyme